MPEVQSVLLLGTIKADTYRTYWKIMSFDLNTRDPYRTSKNHLSGAIGSPDRASYLGKAQTSAGPLRHMLNIVYMLLTYNAAKRMGRVRGSKQQRGWFPLIQLSLVAATNKAVSLSGFPTWCFRGQCVKECSALEWGREKKRIMPLWICLVLML